MEAQAVRCRRGRALLLSLGLALGGFGCGDSGQGPLEPEPGSDDQPGARGVAFADSSLEAAVRTALGQPAGPLTADTVLSLERLSARSRGIVDLHGIEQLQGLKSLDLAENRIVDLTPLAGLIRLTSLDLTSNQVVDLTPLARLDSLQSLALAYNPLRDLSPLLGLGQLQWLEVLGLSLSQAAQESQLPTLRQRGVEISLAPDLTEQPKERPNPGTRILFATERGDYRGTQLFTVDPHDGNPELLAALDSLRFADAEWSPDGSRIAFAATAVNCDTLGYTGGMPNVSCRNDVYLMAGDASSVTNLTHDVPRLSGRASPLSNQPKTAPCWSPDGTQIAFVDWLGGDYWVIDVNSGGLSRLIPDREADWRLGTYKSLSPQWDRIAFLSGEGAKPGTKALYVSDIDGANWIQLVDAVVDKNIWYDASYLAWAPDGRRIAFMANRDRNREVYVVNLDGSGLTRLTSDNGEDWGGAWSPDGRWLAFNTDREY